MARVVIYTKATCTYCIRAKQLLDKKGIDYYEIAIDQAPQRREEMIQKSGGHTVPQIFIDDVAIGGCDDLYQLEQNGSLDEKFQREIP